MTSDRAEAQEARALGGSDRGGRADPSVVLGLELLRRIGSGGEGEVWTARTARGRLRAVKLIRPEALADPDALAHRARWLERIDDPALVRVHRCVVLDEPGLTGWGAMEMDLVIGESLDDACLGPAVFDDLFPLASALDHLHAGVWSDGKSLIHRDIKPANLVRTEDGAVILVDPSSLRGVGTQMTQVGTPAFVAPEVVTGRFGPASDVYSFAATIVALLSGERGDKLVELLDDPWDLDVPDTVSMALSPDPTQRPTLCVDLVDPPAPASEEPILVQVPRGDGTQRLAEASQQARLSPGAWLRLAVLTILGLTAVGGLMLHLPLIVLGAIAALVAALSTDPARRGWSVLWLPDACARWLAARTPGDGQERAWLGTTIHGLLLATLVPGVLVLVGQQGVLRGLGTTAQVSGVALLFGLAGTWLATLVVSRKSRGVRLARAMLFPAWLAGAIVGALGRLAGAVAAAASAAQDDDSDEHSDQEDGVQTQ